MKFRTTLLQSGKTAVGIQVPDEVVEALGAGKRPKVRVTINGYTYRNAIAVMGGVFTARAFGGKKLESDFVNARCITNAGYKLLRFAGARDVQGDNKAFPHPGGCGQTRDHRRMNSHAPLVYVFFAY